jgi:hypothetical protein
MKPEVHRLEPNASDTAKISFVPLAIVLATVAACPIQADLSRKNVPTALTVAAVEGATKTATDASGEAIAEP